jgi:hypothetical protein
MPTKEQCQRRLFQIGLKLGVSPKLISTRLLSPEDKQDMLNGVLPDEALETAVRSWKELGMPDYANGNTTIYNPPAEKPMSRYRGAGKSG